MDDTFSPSFGSCNLALLETGVLFKYFLKNKEIRLKQQCLALFNLQEWAFSRTFFVVVVVE